MLISSRSLLRIHVYTQSGNFLGFVGGIIIDTELHTILQYEVIKGSWIFNRASLLIHHTQVVSISSDKMIVKDEFMKETYIRSLSFLEKWRLNSTAINFL